LELAVKLSDRYITARYLPDKAIDVLDEAGARARIEGLNRPPEIEELSKEIEKVCAQKEDAIAKQHFEEAAKFRDQEKQVRHKREQAIEQWKLSRERRTITVGEDEMLHVVSDWTGIPLSRMEQKESQKLLNLEKELQGNVIGQEYATEVIAKALRRSRADLKDPRRPIGSFMFLGPTGVGKTHLAKTLAERIFGNQDALLQIDMSEYMEKFSVSRLIGSPPGYVGYEEGGQLTEAVRRKPYSVVLFDEIEKAHPDVVQLLLQVLEDGRLTDSLGRTVDFRNTILIMTSNIGAELLQRPASMGFDVGANDAADFEKSKERILEEMKRHFKPEFLNRINQIVIFHPLDKPHMKQIIELELTKVRKRLSGQKIELELDDAAKEFLLAKGWDEKYGARPLRRAIENFLEDPLAEAILRGEVRVGEPIRVTFSGGEALKFEQNQPVI
jgi:ATP-dependent Clp protease ATP-binding subunit ClpC